MIVYHRPRPFPECRYCGEEMGYWVPGLPDDRHAHDTCTGEAIARECADLFRKNLRQNLEDSDAD